MSLKVKKYYNSFLCCSLNFYVLISTSYQNIYVIVDSPVIIMSVINTQQCMLYVVYLSGVLIFKLRHHRMMGKELSVVALKKYR